MKLRSAEVGFWFVLAKKAALTALAVVLAAACFYLFKTLTIRRIAHAQVVSTPFVLEAEAYHFDGDTQGELLSKRTVARRSDGATVLMSNVGPVGWGETSRRITFMDGRSVSIVDSLETKTTWPVVPDQRLASLKEQLLRPPRNCIRVGETLLGYGKVLGQDTAVIRGAPLSGDDPLRLTHWRAPDLACQNLGYRVEERQGDGSWRLITVGRTVSLNLQEPDPRLFQVAPGYTELKPSEVQRKLFEKMGVPPDHASDNEVERLDNAYLRR